MYYQNFLEFQVSSNVLQPGDSCSMLFHGQNQIDYTVAQLVKKICRVFHDKGRQKNTRKEHNERQSSY